MPERSEELLTAGFNNLEKHYRDVQDVEFTIEQGRLYLLQTRNAKRTALSSVKTAVDMVREGMIDREQALLRVDPEEITQLLVPQFAADLMSQDELAERLVATGAGSVAGGCLGAGVLRCRRCPKTWPAGESRSFWSAPKPSQTTFTAS